MSRMNIKPLQDCITHNRYEISLHAQEERNEEEITLQEIEKAILNGEIIEDYPQDLRGPSCLVLGYAQERPIHIVCAILPNHWMRIITVYIPRGPKWINPKERRK